MIGDPDAWYRLEHDATLLSSVQWLDLAETWESRATNSFDVEEIRYAAESAKLCRAVARWRQMYAEVIA